MCTFITMNSEDFFIGRNMDIEYSFGEKIVITPRDYDWKWRKLKPNKESYAIIGMATIVDEYPLYAEGVNEYGLTMASLNFPNNAKYNEFDKNKINLTPFEIIPYMLSNFKSIKEAKDTIYNLNFLNEQFKDGVPLAPLHYIIADREECLVIEPQEDGVHIYDNEIGVLTNNPPFPNHLINLENYMNLRIKNPNTAFSETIKPKPYGQGLGSVGLPGDSSPMSRFVRAAYYKLNTMQLDEKYRNKEQMFHILDSVAMLRGSVLTEDDKWDITTYSACVNATKGIYYLKTYDNLNIRSISIKDNLEGKELKSF